MIFEKYLKENFMTIRPAGDEMFYVGGRTDMTKVFEILRMLLK
jgi:hypothetical protein